MNGQMDDHMNKQELNHWLHSRKWKRILLISEFVYVVILMLTLVFNFSVFMHLVVFQGIAIFIYLLVGWIFDKGDSAVSFKSVIHYGKRSLAFVLIVYSLSDFRNSYFLGKRSSRHCIWT